MSYVIELFKRFYNWIMGLVDKQKNTSNSKFEDPTELTKNEMEFILAKLRLSTYTGEEFEMFYNVWKKVSNKLEKLS